MMKFSLKSLLFILLFTFCLSANFDVAANESFPLIAANSAKSKKHEKKKHTATHKTTSTKKKGAHSKIGKKKEKKQAEKKVISPKTVSLQKEVIPVVAKTKTQDIVCEEVKAAESDLPTAGDDYFHSYTATHFPQKLNEFERTQIVVFKNEPNRIEATYQLSDGGDKTWFTVKMIPMNEGMDGRLRNEYLTEIAQILKKNEKWETPAPVFLKKFGRKFTCNGIEGTFSLAPRKNCQVRVFECGTWLFSVYLTSDKLEMSDFQTVSSKITDYFNPPHLTELRPLKAEKPYIDFERELLKDTVLMGPVIGGGFLKLDWVNDHVSAAERASGFPDLYLPMHVDALSEIIKRGKTKNMSDSPWALQYYEDLAAINDAGFLPEFIMEQFKRVMIVPPTLSLNYEGFDKWKEGKNIKLDLNKKLYSICYRTF